MRRKRKSPDPENHERWLVSYADFITLLFAFFVVMFASSQTDRVKAKQLSESVRQALNNGGMSHSLARIWGKPAAPAAPPPPPPPSSPGGPQPELLQSLHQLTASLGQELQKGSIEIRLEGRGLIISLQEKAFFPSGTDAIDPSTIPVLAKVAQEIQRLPNSVRLEGHTDSVPIRTSRFRSNWDLSAARSIAVLRLFAGEFHIAPVRMAVAGYADSMPVASNETVDGRSRNRRVDLVILNERFGFDETPTNEAGR